VPSVERKAVKVFSLQYLLFLNRGCGMITATQFIELQAGDPSGLWIGRMNGVRISVITKVQKRK
jgi:hypothetical protein